MPIALKKDEKYTYSNYLSWDDGERWEIINGKAYNMSPAPKIRHQDVAANFYITLRTSPGNSCYTGIAPTDVVFDDYNVVQPDVFIVCNRNKILDTHIQGAPELIIEVTSPTTAVKDRREKKDIYERFGVSEYIIVFTEEEYLERYVLKDGKYTFPEIYNKDETIKLVSLAMEINLMTIFL